MSSLRSSGSPAFSVSAPATTANLGPGFDSIGLALDLWNEAAFFFEPEGLSIEIHGIQPNCDGRPENNLIYRSFAEFCRILGKETPRGLRIVCQNHIPASSGLGSSASAILLGILAADAWLESGLSADALLEIATGIEGHPDNLAAAIHGGLVAVCGDRDSFHTEKFPAADWKTVIAVPKLDLSTRASRAVLPKNVTFQDAVFNLSHALLLPRAFENGSECLLALAMRDRLHQPYRLPLIPDSETILQAAKTSGAAASVLSGAGPSIISFMRDDPAPVLTKMRAILDPILPDIDYFTPGISPRGATVTWQS